MSKFQRKCLFTSKDTFDPRGVIAIFIYICMFDPRSSRHLNYFSLKRFSCEFRENNLLFGNRGSSFLPSSASPAVSGRPVESRGTGEARDTIYPFTYGGLRSLIACPFAFTRSTRTLSKSEDTEILHSLALSAPPILIRRICRISFGNPEA